MLYQSLLLRHHPTPKRPTNIRKLKASSSQSSGPTTLVADEIVHEERGDSVERATTAASLDAEQDSGNIIRTQSMATLNEPIPQGTSSGSGPKRQDTILGDRPAQTRFERLSKQSNDPPLSRVNTLRSGEDSMKLNELMEICTRLSERVLALENIKTAQNLEIINLKKRVKKLEKKKKARTPQLKRRLFKVRIESSAENSLGDQEDASKQGRNGIDQDEKFHSINITTPEPVTTVSAPVTTAGVSISTTKPSTPPTTTILIEDEDLTIAQTLMKMRSVKSKEKSKEKVVSSETTIRPTKGVIMKEASETVTIPIVPPQQQLDPKDKGKEEQGKLTIEERSKLFVELVDKKKKHFAKLRAEEIRRKPPTKAQKRNQMCTYLKNMANYKHSQLKNKSFEEIQMLFDNTMKWVDSFVLMDSEVLEESKSQAEGSKKRTRKELDEESVKRQKLEDDAEKAKLKACLEIVPGDAVTIESLATKYSIVDWKTHILAEDKMYYQITRADGSAKFYKIFSAMLDDFDRHDVLDLYKLVKERFETTSPEGYDRLLWGDQITLFEPITVAGYIPTAGEVQRKYSKSLLLLVVKLLLLVLVTTARRVSAVRV
ncbi:hypothetical protein Tco_0695629 [Tanacetum coccineum]